VIMLTARTAQRDRVTGLDAGADDYLPKPFEPGELLARIRAVLRRTGREGVKPDVIEAAGFELDARSREIRSGKKGLEVTSLEFDILELLMRSAGRVVSRDELMTVLHHRQSNAKNMGLRTLSFVKGGAPSVPDVGAFQPVRLIFITPPNR